MKDILVYRKEEKTPAREINPGDEKELESMVTQYMLNLKPPEHCPVGCEYARILQEDVRVQNLVYEHGDIVCGFTPGAEPLECNLYNLRIDGDGNVMGECHRIKKHVKIDQRSENDY